MRTSLLLLLLFCLSAIPALSLNQNKDSLNVLYFKSISDSLYSKKQNDSAVFYLRKALESLAQVEKGSWRVKEVSAIAQRLYRAGELSLSEKYFLQALEEAGDTDSLLLANTQQWVGDYFTDRAQYGLALDLLKKAAQAYEDMDEKIQWAETLIRIGTIFDDQGLYDRSLEYYFNANTIYESVNDTLGMSYVLSDVAITYARQKDYATAVGYYNKALAFYEKKGDSVLIVNTMINLGVTHKNLGDYSQSATLFDHALKFYSNRGDSYALAAIHHNMGELMAIQDKPTEALIHYQNSQEHAAKIDAREIMVQNYTAMSKLYLKINDLEKSLASCLSSLDIALKLNTLEAQRDVYKVMVDIYKKKGDYNRAVDIYGKLTSLQDSLFSEDRTKQIQQMKARFEVFQKDAEINSLKMEKRLQAERNEAQRKLTTFLIVGGIALLVMMALLTVAYWRSKKLNGILKGQKKLLVEQHEAIQASQEELKVKNESLVRLNSEKDEIIAMVAHDLRSPLNNIKGLIFLLSSDPSITSSSDSKQCLVMLNDVADTMKNRINHMLNVEALNAGKINLQMERVAARQIIDSVAHNFKEQARKKHIQLVVDAINNGFHVQADPNYLLQIYENLVTNALKFSPEGKTVWLKLTGENKRVFFHVIDQGPGIHPDERERLFSKFQTLRAKPTQGEDSSGLGLAIVKKYVEAMNGRVWCESSPGRGAEFIIELPAA